MWLCAMGLAAPFGNVVGLVVSLWHGTVRYPHYTISQVIRTGPGLNVVACGWQLFAASYAVLSWILHGQLLLATERVSHPEDLERWAEVRALVTVALLIGMSVIHICPVQPTETLSRHAARDALHYTLASSFAVAGVLEVWVTVVQIEPILTASGISLSNGAWLRWTTLYASPLWIFVGLLMSASIAYDREDLAAYGGILEFFLLTLYGCYLISVIGLVTDLQNVLGCVGSDTMHSVSL